ncbi:MAG: hypothetical protein ACREL5_03875 [Gemmatimonadales bacterium]
MRLHAPQPYTKHYMVWWGGDGHALAESYIITDVDLMLGRLDNFDPASVGEYPIFKDPASPIRQGTSLCRLGYPFPHIQVDFDAAANRFDFKAIALQSFAIDGILTRQMEVGTNAAGYKHVWLETSSPGLKGQSGGPIIDVDGTVWSVQAHTDSMSLDFDPAVPNDRTGRKEHQFLNVGRGAHPATIVGLLNEKHVSHVLGR